MPLDKSTAPVEVKLESALAVRAVPVMAVPVIVVAVSAAGVVPPMTVLLIVPPVMVGVVRVPLAESTFELTAVATLLNSVSISVPLTIFKGLPDVNASLVAKLVLFV